MQLPQDPVAPQQGPTALLDGLLDYILEQARQVNPRGFRLSLHQDFKATRARIAGLPGVELDTGTEADPVLLRVARLSENRPPALADRTQASLLTIPTEPSGTDPSVSEGGVLARVEALALAEVRERAAERGAVQSEGQGGPIRGDTASEVTEARRAELLAQVRREADSLLAGYLPAWKRWAEVETPRRRSIVLYGELFSLGQRLADDTANPCELVWGIGVATWQIPQDGGPIAFEYPLITQALELAVDRDTFGIELTPRLLAPRLEVDAFVACNIPAAVATDLAVRKAWEAPGAPMMSPFDASSYSPALRSVAGNLEDKGEYLEVKATDAPVPSPGEHLVVTDEWVLLARPKRANHVEDDIQRLKANLAALTEVPAGPRALVTPPSRDPIVFEPVSFRGLSSSRPGDGGAGGAPEVRELFFPAPYNDEQLTIVQQLERAPGVTVQGPPGTGKTHTIANIVCHYLATGRRVLVTSAGEPALRVLQQKVPESVRALSVALIASDREGMRQFEASIRSIQQRITQLDEVATQAAIERAARAVDLAHAEINGIDRRVDEIAHAQLADFVLDGVGLKASALAELVVSGSERCGWFPDELTAHATHAPPLTEEEAARLRSARRLLGPDLAYVGRAVPVADGFPPPADIARLHGILVRIRTLDAQARAHGAAALKDTEPGTLVAAGRLMGRLGEARALAEELEAHDAPWPLQLRLKCSLPSFLSERAALEALFSELDTLADDRAAFLQRPVVFPEAGLACPRTREAVERGSQTGKPFGLFAFAAGAAREHVPAIRIAALEPRSAEDWQHVHRYLRLHDKVLSASARWNAFAGLLGLPDFDGGIGSLRHIEAVTRAARQAHRLATAFDAHLASEARAVLLEVVEADFRGSAAQFERCRLMLQNHLTRSELAGAAHARLTLRSIVDGRSGPVVDELLGFCDTVLGDERLTPEEAALAFDRLMAELRRLAGLAQPLSLVVQLAGRIESAGAPKLAERVRTEPAPEAGDDGALPANWRDAWQWARVRTHLSSIEARAELLGLAERRRSLGRALSRLYEEMVSNAAWLATKRNATGAVMAALNGYATAMQRLGKGTGTNAARYRRDAREAMLEAAGAVPCWIMSHARVSEAMPPRIGSFDLVIVDEASQSNLWALPAILRAKKILVVGDDKQVSPSAGFIEAARITELRSRFLSGQPYGVEMTPEKSLYDLAARVFAATQVMLREHFRCVPAIIAYSNREFYEGNIQPLRIASGAERIDPPLVDLYVPGGVRDAKDVNDGEAQAIATEIDAIIADSRLAGRTIGVVTLMGTGQARHIDAVVRGRCDPGELLRRDFEVGDAPTFQGSERDIVFLSMVVDRSNCHALSGLTYEQRFNVAASRARDRMVLVRSVQMNELSPADALRRSLLAHFEQPMVTHEAQAAELIDRCESGFERDVFTTLTGMGYRVTPQVPAGAYRIDLVVEGEGDRRLAVECDGDAFHGPERWGADMARQRVLERAGWTFWRCFASTWTLRRNEVVGELLQMLGAMGIEPVGALVKAPGLVERRRHVPETIDEIGDAVVGAMPAPGS